MPRKPRQQVDTDRAIARGRLAMERAAARRGDDCWNSAQQFLSEARRARRGGDLRYAFSIASAAWDSATTAAACWDAVVQSDRSYLCARERRQAAQDLAAEIAGEFPAREAPISACHA